MKKHNLDFRPFLTIRVIISTFLVFIGAILLFRLGLWQISRYFDRQAFNRHYIMQQALPMMDLTTSTLNDLEKFEYRKVLVRGTYDHQYSIARANQYFEGNLGYGLMTPLVLEDGSAIFIDRGWIPVGINPNEPNWDEFTQELEVEIEGVLRNSVNTFGDGKNQDEKIWVDFYPGDLQKIIPYPIAHVFIQPNISDGNIPPIIVTIPVEITEGPHLSYAGQWFAFGLLLLIGYPFVLRKSGLLHIFEDTNDE